MGGWEELLTPILIDLTCCIIKVGLRAKIEIAVPHQEEPMSWSG
jgi:hypothetical protein